MPLMFRTIDGTLVSDNEFADMGLYESEEMSRTAQNTFCRSQITVPMWKAPVI